ncbi:MAG: hypothetical protein RBR42_05025 [Desulfomicrobium sp.]|nr:hypothetical protein [Desulfomicrobium sp.]
MANDYKIILLALVELLKEQGIEGAGKVDGLNAYQALLEVQTQANVLGIPLSDIGLRDFDIDTLLNPDPATDLRKTG